VPRRAHEEFVRNTRPVADHVPSRDRARDDPDVEVPAEALHEPNVGSALDREATPLARRSRSGARAARVVRRGMNQVLQSHLTEEMNRPSKMRDGCNGTARTITTGGRNGALQQPIDGSLQ
jgi:hypothetical protein